MLDMFLTTIVVQSSFRVRVLTRHASKYKVHKLHEGYSLSHSSEAVCESRGGRPGLSVLTSLLVSVDVKL